MRRATARVGGRWRRRGAVLGAFGAALAVLPGGFAEEESLLGRARRFVLEAREGLGGMTASALSTFQDPALDVFLPPAQPDAFGRIPRTLVLDLEGTLVRSSYERGDGWNVTKRPGTDELLNRAFHAGYEVVIFSENADYMAQGLVANLDPNQYSTNVLFRENLTVRQGRLMKDLGRMGRDLARVLLVDDSKEAVAMFPDNAVLVSPWDGNKDDVELIHVIHFIDSMAKQDVRDVREVIRSYGRTDVLKKFVKTSLDRKSEKKTSQNKSSGGGSMFGLFKK